MRVVSLIASSTEIVCALGMGRSLVGRSHECDFPQEVLELPACSSPDLPVHAPSREIDAEVRRKLALAQPLYRVDAARLRELRPDVILTQIQCEVCAVSEQDVLQALGDWSATEARPKVVALNPGRLSDLETDVRRVAEALGIPERGAALASALSAGFRAVSERASRSPRVPTVACLEWTEPAMVAGNWVPELVSLAGGRPLLAEPARRSPAIRWEDLEAADPDVVVAMPCGFGLARSRAETAALPRLESLRAAREGRVFVTDANQYMTRPGPRLVESAEILAEILHPDLFAPRHRGTAWEPL